MVKDFHAAGTVVIMDTEGWNAMCTKKMCFLGELDPVEDARGATGTQAETQMAVQ